MFKKYLDMVKERGLEGIFILSKQVSTISLIYSVILRQSFSNRNPVAILVG